MNTPRNLSGKLVWFLLASVLFAVLATSTVTRQALAADDDKAAAGDGSGAPRDESHDTNFFVWVAKVSGIIGVVILCLSIYFVATVSRLFYEMRMINAVPPDTVAQVEELLQQRDFKQIFNVVKDDDSHFARMLSTGISELPNGLAEARDVMERVGEAIHVENEKKISMLAVLGTLGPMIGLLGTLKGMIASFSEIAIHDQQLKASAVAGGISEALVLTFEGVALSVPSIYFFALFRNRISQIGTQAALESDQFLRHFAHAARAKTPAAGAAPAKAAAATTK
jgi:biopolymer transport protein ExbB